jgi:hypothetical protein
MAKVILRSSYTRQQWLSRWPKKGELKTLRFQAVHYRTTHTSHGTLVLVIFWLSCRSFLQPHIQRLVVVIISVLIFTFLTMFTVVQFSQVVEIITIQTRKHSTLETHIGMSRRWNLDLLKSKHLCCMFESFYSLTLRQKDDSPYCERQLGQYSKKGTNVCSYLMHITSIHCVLII